MNITTTISVAVFVAVLAFIAIVIWRLLSPDESEEIHFRPFPVDDNDKDVTPTLSCETNADCTRQIGEHTKCTYLMGGSQVKVDPDTGDVTEIPTGDYDSIILPGGDVVQGPGSYCLPKGLREKGCDPRYSDPVWTEKGWQCSCRWPTLFGGDRCSEQLACRDSKLYDGDSQDKNKLIDTQTGEEWSPYSGTDPLGMDEQGQPNTICECNAKVPGFATKGFTRLPGDPHRCHVDLCGVESIDQDAHLTFSDNGQSKCDCSASSDIITRSDGRCGVDPCQRSGGKAVDIEPAPPEGHLYVRSMSGTGALSVDAFIDDEWINVGSKDVNMDDIADFEFPANPDKIQFIFEGGVNSESIELEYMKYTPYGSTPIAEQKCKCPNGTIERKCSSRWKEDSSLPKCIDPDNYLGSECVDPCLTNPCGTGLCMRDSSTNKGWKCKCPDGSTSNNACSVCYKGGTVAEYDNVTVGPTGNWITQRVKLFDTSLCCNDELDETCRYGPGTTRPCVIKCGSTPI